jgi:alanyl-tRNA synthetase
MTVELTADQLRSTFISFFQERNHHLVPSANLIPNHPRAPLFTNAGMVQFLPIFFGEEESPYPRAVSSQKCVRIRGKHDDIEEIGRTTRHLTFFEMLGNFSFGDYFKGRAIEYAWEFLTEELGVDGDRLWVTVHETDDEAVELWHDLVGMPIERIQKMGEDNFWEMGSTGPCGPSSEVFFDKGPRWGDPGGPLTGGIERYVEIWNLVFMTFNRLDGGELVPLPARNIDTGAGMERILPILQRKDSVFETDVLRRLIAAAEELSGAPYGRDLETDVSLRILADHSRAISFLLADGVVPSNEERGYVLRRIIRRAARHAQRLGADEPVLPAMAAAVERVMRAGYPELSERLDFLQETLEREEERFLDNLGRGMSILEAVLADNRDAIPGETAFRLHDTYGFPIELTAEIAEEQGVGLDRSGFDLEMERQRERARGAMAGDEAPESAARLRDLVQEASRFVGYDTLEQQARVAAALPGEKPGEIDLFTDSTPFYGESGGQIGDTGSVVGPAGKGRVLDTDRPAPGLIRHLVKLEQGDIEAGQSVLLKVDPERRDAIRRAHTATHLLHWALRTTFGEHLHQQGSLVGPDHLRFDFNHHTALTEAEISRLETLVLEQLLGDGEVRTDEMALDEARAAGALMFFGEKYGEHVRVVSAGTESRELCGGTHVRTLGQIGGFLISSESSVGSNLRRIEAVTAHRAHEQTLSARAQLREAARALRVGTAEVPVAVERLREQLQSEERKRRQLEERFDRELVKRLRADALDGIVVARCDGRDQEGLRSLVEAIVGSDMAAAGLVGSPDGESVALAVALGAASDRDARQIVRETAKAVGGGGGGKDPLVAVGGGPEVSAVDQALQSLRIALGG